MARPACEKLEFQKTNQAYDHPVHEPEQSVEKARTFTSNDEGVKRRLVRKIALVLPLVVLFAIVLAAGVELARCAGRVLPGVHVGMVDLSRLGPEQARDKILEFAQSTSSRALTLEVGSARAAVSAQEVGFAIDAPASVTRALSCGREGATVTNWLGVMRRWFRPAVVPFVAHLDPERVAERMRDLSQTLIADPPFAGGLRVADAQIEAEYPRAGHVLEQSGLAAALRDAWLGGVKEVTLATRVETPRVQRAEVDRIVRLARQLANGALELTAADSDAHITLNSAEIAAILRARAASEDQLSVVCDPDALDKLIAPHKAAIERAAQDARFQIDDQDHVHVVPGHAAAVLDAARVAESVCSAAASSERRAVLPVTVGAEPALSTEAALALGIRGLVSSFSTHHVCCQPRVQNIHHIADLLTGTLVRPGETFSINQKLGPRSVKGGFVPAPSIEDGDMVDTIGGGVSQFATTIFNALFYGGYDIIERQPHTYWFTRYPMGYDATLSYPHPDIVFKNDSDAGVLIQTAYTDTTITVKLYGDNGGRKVRAQISERQNIVQPPLEYIPNRSLDADREKTREGGMIGWSVITKRIITFPNGQSKEEKRKVTYKPRARRVEVHPCRIPAGEPGHTGERCPVPEATEAEGSSEPAAQ
ncbi:MAG TPA: VanW family protein [Polyangiaceae bacterium]|jgi:vancomycin resistance protein YoaR